MNSTVIAILSPIVVQLLTPELIEPAARLLAGSMRDNPLHRRIFASNEAQIEPLLATAFARLLQRQMRTGLVLCAFDDEALVGVAAMVPPGHCQPTLQDKLAMLVILARGRVLRHLPKIQRWLRIWAPWAGGRRTQASRARDRKYSDDGDLRSAGPATGQWLPRNR